MQPDNEISQRPADGPGFYVIQVNDEWTLGQWSDDWLSFYKAEHDPEPGWRIIGYGAEEYHHGIVDPRDIGFIGSKLTINELSQSGGTVQPSSADARSAVFSQAAQSGARHVVERCAGGGGRAVYEVLDMTRHVSRRVICRTNFADANMIRDALADTGEEYLESHEVLGDLVHLWSEHEALNGGGPGWQSRFREAFMRACDLVRREP